MARVNIYLPDDLAARAREADLNISAVARSALEEELVRVSGDAWLDGVAALAPVGISHDDVMAALDAVRAEMGQRGHG